jgi:hypothetical protein
MTRSTLKQTGMQHGVLVFCEGTDLCTIDFKDIHFRDSVAVSTNIMYKRSNIQPNQHEHVYTKVLTLCKGTNVFRNILCQYIIYEQRTSITNFNLINTWEIYWLWDFRKLPAYSQIVNENDALTSFATTRRLYVKLFP